MTATVEVRSAFADLPRVNLMPPEIEQDRKLRRTQLALVAAVLAAVAVVAGGYYQQTRSVTTAEQQLQDATSQQARVQAETAKYRGVTDLYARAAAGQTMLTQAMSDEIRFSQFMNALTTAMPANVWLATVAYTTGGSGGAAPAAGATASTGPGTVTLGGVAYAYADVAAWLDSLAKQQGYATPVLQSSTEALLNNHKVVNWSTTVPLTAAALSGRYLKAGG